MTDEIAIPPQSRDRQSVDMSSLHDSLGYRLRRAQITVFHLFSRYFAALNIRPTQYAILTLVRDNPGLSQTQISDSLGLKRANLVALLDELEDRELLVRKPSPSDRRSYQLHLTENGQLKMVEIAACHDQYENELTAKLGASGRQTLLDLLSALHHPADSSADPDID